MRGLCAGIDDWTQLLGLQYAANTEAFIIFPPEDATSLIWAQGPTEGRLCVEGHFASWFLSQKPESLLFKQYRPPVALSSRLKP